MIQSPFTRLNDLLGDSKPGAEPLALSVGEPKHAIPDFVGPILQANLADFSRYPLVWGTDGFRQSVARWAARRYPGLKLDPQREIMVLNGSREGLLSATQAAALDPKRRGRGSVLMPNPFYPPYYAAAVACSKTPVLLPSTQQTGFLPDLDSIPPSVLDDALAIFLCSPSNPEGAVASRDYILKAIGLARKHNFMLFADECYSEIYSGEAPAGALEVAASTGSFQNVIALNSLSKRSNLAGLRIGFVAGDPAFMQTLAAFRNVTCAQVPLPVQAVAEAAYGDETHVVLNRRLYAEKFEDAERILGNRFGRVTPGGGFFLWLDVRDRGGDEEATKRLWVEHGLRVVPGRYLAAPDAQGHNPAEGFIRVALVHERAITAAALEKLVDTLR
jgi:N-succinyldiaminopimelate aminotransferase